LKIGEKYKPTKNDKKQLNSIADLTGIQEAFTNLCYKLIVLGYRKIIKCKKITSSWDEEDISDFLAEQIEQCCRDESYPYHIDTDSRDRSVSVDGIKIKGKKRKRFDIKFSFFSDPKTENVFGVEAKLLIENNMPPKLSTTLLEAYISITGMRKIIEGTYSKPTCMVGYVIEGTPEGIIKKLNDRINKDDFYDKASALKKVNLIDDFEHMYESTHKKYMGSPLRHIFMDLK
jgi:hypothetical protein